MTFRVKPSAFDIAIPMLDRIRAQGWIWQGQQELDGLCCIKGWFSGKGWLQALLPWLEQTSEILETEDYVLLLFEKPVLCDCGKLGRLLPLRQSHGALTSFPIMSSGESIGPGSAIKDHLLLFLEGERHIEPLSAFHPVDIAQWWSFEEVQLQETFPLPLKTIIPRVSKPLNSLPFDPDQAEAGLEEIRERLGKIRQTPGRILADLARKILVSFLRIFIWLVIIWLVIWLFTHGVGEVDWGVASLIGVLVAIALICHSPQEPIGSEGSAKQASLPQGTGSGSPRPGRFTKPGLAWRMAGWLLWNSALGSGVRGKYAARFREIEELFAKGKLDEALRKAVSLGQKGNAKERKKHEWFSNFPLSGPAVRDNLDIQNKIASAHEYGILTDPGFQDLKEMYERQAESLLAKGDFDRAAFIYAELLDDADAAVRVFERKGDLKLAAKLAQGRRLPPSRFIPLWFKAGEKSKALKLSAQYDAFTDLAEYVPENDPFHKELIKAWSERLIEIRDHARALEITEKYPEFATQRLVWITEALEEKTVDVTLIARALKCLPELEGKRVQALFQDIVQKNTPEQALQRIQLAQYLADEKFEKASEYKDYSSKRLPLLSLSFIRRLLEDEAQFGSDKNRHNAALKLAKTSEQLALRVDIHRIKPVATETIQPPSRRIELKTARNLTPVRDAICLHGNRLLVAYDYGGLHLLNMQGRKLWHDHIHNIRGLVPVGSGELIIIIRGEIEGDALSLLNLHDRTHKDVGFINLQGFHKFASEVGWMVVLDGQLSMLDTSSILAAAKNGKPLEHHWTVPLTEAGQVINFINNPNMSAFLYLRQEGDLAELWTIEKATLKVNCQFITLAEKPHTDIQSFFWTGGGNIWGCSDDGTKIKQFKSTLTNYSLKTERQLLADKKSWLTLPQFVAAPNFSPKGFLWSSLNKFPRAANVPATNNGNTEKKVIWAGAFNQSLQSPFVFDFPEADWGHARTAPYHSSPVVIFDNFGRIVVADCENYKILMRNDLG